MKRSLALFGVLALLCAAMAGCTYHGHDHGGYSHGRHWQADHPRYQYGGSYGGTGGYYRDRHHRHDYRDYCD